MLIHWISQFNDTGALSKIYLDKTDRTRKGAINAQEQFSITDQSTTVGTLLDCTDCKILLDSGATQSFMSKQYNLRNKSLHRLPNFSSKAKLFKQEMMKV